MYFLHFQILLFFTFNFRVNLGKYQAKSIGRYLLIFVWFYFHFKKSLTFAVHSSEWGVLEVPIVKY